MSAAEGAGRGAPPAGSTAGAPSFPARGVTEVRGPAQDVQAQLFGEGDPWRPAAQGFTSAREVAAAAEGARQSMSVHGGAAPGQGGGILTLDGDGLRSTSEDLGRAAGELGEAAAALVPLTAELELWALTGQVLLGDAAALSGALVASVLEHTAGVALTATGTRLPVSELVKVAAHATPHLAVFSAATGQALYLGRGRRLHAPARRARPPVCPQQTGPAARWAAAGYGQHGQIGKTLECSDPATA